MTFDLSQATWRKAAASTSGNGGCVELATNLPQGCAAMRDSTRPDAGAHVTTRAVMRALLEDVRAGTYDI